jgi:hypothetical protein
MSLDYSIKIPDDLTMPDALRNLLGFLRNGYQENHSKKISDARMTLSGYEKMITPGIKDAGKYIGENMIVKISLDVENKARLGKTAFAAMLGDTNTEEADFNNDDLINLTQLIDELIKKDLIRAFKSIGDGGVVVALCEMAVLGNCGISAHLLSYDYYNQAFNEEVSILLEVDRRKYDEFMNIVHDFYCKDTHPFPDLPTACVESKHHYFNINCFALTQKEEIIDIWWGVNSKMNIKESTQTIKLWFNI